MIVSQPELVAEQQPTAPMRVEKPVQKQRLNVYTVMLILSFLALCIASILLYMELQRWGSFPWWNTQGL